MIRPRLSAADGSAVVAALEHARAALDHEQHSARDEIRDASDSSAEDPPPSASSTAEWFVHLAQVGLQAMASTRPETVRRARSQLVAQVDPLSGWARLADDELPPPGSLAALETPGWRWRPLVATDLTRFDLGRTQRLPSLDLRELLGTLDGQRCRVLGCTRHRDCPPTT